MNLVSGRYKSCDIIIVGIYYHSITWLLQTLAVKSDSSIIEQFDNSNDHSKYPPNREVLPCSSSQDFSSPGDSNSHVPPSHLLTTSVSLLSTSPLSSDMQESLSTIILVFESSPGGIWGDATKPRSGGWNGRAAEALMFLSSFSETTGSGVVTGPTLTFLSSISMPVLSGELTYSAQAMTYSDL